VQQGVYYRENLEKSGKKIISGKVRENVKLSWKSQGKVRENERPTSVDILCKANL